MRCLGRMFGLPGVLATALIAFAADRDDILLADFEGPDYGTWRTTGDAFGSGPARGTLPGQMPVSGFRGKGLANSFRGGDRSTGTLTSPEFPINRRFVSFLIGGGGHAGKTCINLVVNGKTVRTATGPNQRPGGSEHLDPGAWDVADLAGQSARIEIVDQATGGWGHINIDHIVLTDRKPQGLLVDASRELTVDGRYLHLPVKTGAPRRRMSLELNGQAYREFDIELAEAAPDYWAFLDLEKVKGQKLFVRVGRLPENSTALKSLAIGNTIPGMENLYREKHRPQFHFTSRRGWLNDPNGLVWSQGEYHLFYQHNPYGWAWGNMHWGHAVSKDLIHWEERPIALYPQRFGDWCYSGSAVVDRDNRSGFRKGTGPVLVAAYTSTGRGECIVFSNDNGRTWTEYEGNPVVKHAGRDPRLLWHEASRQWVMAVYDEEGKARHIAFYTSPDLKKWQFRSRIEGYYECPDLFSLPVDGDASRPRWVLYAADGKYAVGQFDGQAFTVESGKHQLWHGNFYAAQTFSDAPDGRRIQIGWGRGISFPGMPFNQQMTIPCELTLRTTEEGVRLFARPVKELELLHGRKQSWKDLPIRPGANPLADVKEEIFELRVEFRPGDAEQIVFLLRGLPLVYEVRKQELRCKDTIIPLKPEGGRVRLQALVDRGSVELFGNDGRVALSIAALHPVDDLSLSVAARGGTATATVLELHPLKSTWK